MLEKFKNPWTLVTEAHAKAMLQLQGQEKECNLHPNELNKFHTRFEHEFTKPLIPSGL